MQKFIIITGVVLILIGLLWPWLRRLPLGHLPGDIVIRTENATLYIPLGTMILVSLVLSLVMWRLRR